MGMELHQVHGNAQIQPVGLSLTSGVKISFPPKRWSWFPIPILPPPFSWRQDDGRVDNHRTIMADWMDEDDEEVQHFQEPQQPQQPQLFGEDDNDDDDDDDEEPQNQNDANLINIVNNNENGDEDEGDIFDDMEGDDLGNQQKDSLLMRFCPNDSSMLYPQAS